MVDRVSSNHVVFDVIDFVETFGDLVHGTLHDTLGNFYGQLNLIQFSGLLFAQP